MNAKKIKKIVSVCLTIFLLVIFIFTPLFTLWEYRLQDAAYQRGELLHPDIMVIGIDEDALNAHGAWPWPRHIMADALEILNRYEYARPAVIAIDIMYTEESRFPDDDARLVQAVYGADNVLLASLIVAGIDRTLNIIDARGLDVARPIPELLPHVRYGIVNGISDHDGVKRNALLWEEHGGERLYSFPLMAARMYMEHFGIYETSPFIQENNTIFVRYSGYPGLDGDMGQFFWHSFAEIFYDDFDPSMLADMIVFIGPYAVGMMDQHPVPIRRDALMFGVEIHANVTQAILDGHYMRRVEDFAAMLIIAVILISAMLLGEFTDIRVLLAVLAIAAGAYFFGAVYFFREMQLVVPLFVPLVSIGIVAVYQLIYGYVLQALEKSKLRSTFKMYVDPKLVDSLIESGEADNSGAGKKKHIAVIFVDVRGFTPMTESLRDTPELIVETLNEYLELTSTAVFNNGGSVDKFIGDATMALFNGFVPLDDYVFRAVKAAWDMVEGADAVNRSIKEKYGIDIGFGVGVHCGEAIVGNLGPSFRKDYTAIGDTVNTAARLESNAKKSQVLISRDVYDLLGSRIKAESIGEIPLKGKSVPLEIFSLAGVNSTPPA